MSEEERSRWEERYAGGDYEPVDQPSPFLVSALTLMPPGRAMVLACGAGRNAIRLAEAGFDVEGVDISSVAIGHANAEAGRRGLDVRFHTADLDALELAGGVYDLITMIRYVNRPTWPRMVEALAPDGWLFIEQHLRTRRDVSGPGDDFRVGPGELLEAFSGMRVVQYFEGLEDPDQPGETAAIASLLACKGDPGW